MKAYLEIEMPNNCNGCPLHFYEGQGICSCCVLPTIEDDEILKPWKNKRKDCPLVPVPPHGRLGDLDELARKIEHDRYNHTHTDGMAARHHIAEYGHFLKEIADIPTIIPADNPKEE